MQQLYNIGVVQQAGPANAGGRQDALPHPTAQRTLRNVVPFGQQAAVRFGDRCGIEPLLRFGIKIFFILFPP